MDVQAPFPDQVEIDNRVEIRVLDHVVYMTIEIVVHPTCRNGVENLVIGTCWFFFHLKSSFLELILLLRVACSMTVCCAHLIHNLHKKRNPITAWLACSGSDFVLVYSFVTETEAISVP